MEACGRCVAACPRQCFQHVDETPSSACPVPVLHRQHCDLCLACAAVCPTGALTRVGEALTARQVVDFCRQDTEIFALSGGGITLSGGEPLFRPVLAAETLRLARGEGMHSALETCGWFDMDNPQVREALSCLDLCIVDLKHVDSAPHQRHTGVDVQRIHGKSAPPGAGVSALAAHGRITSFQAKRHGGRGAAAGAAGALRAHGARGGTGAWACVRRCHVNAHWARPQLWSPALELFWIMSGCRYCGNRGNSFPLVLMPGRR